MTLQLTSDEEAMLAGRAGEAVRLAMRILIEMAGVARADRFLEVTSAHIDGGLYHGRAGLDFAERFASSRARVAVPTTLNVASLDLLHPDLYRGDPDTAAAARRLMEFYVEMGCRQTWTCAPYQLPERPGFGEHVAWAESNAIVFANSVLGARTERYGDFIDACAAITGRVPDAGLHTDPGRRATFVLRLSLPEALLGADVLYPVVGHLLGGLAGSRVAAIEGLPVTVGEDRLKALGAAAASSGSVALFHAIGLTREAPTLETIAAEGADEFEVTGDDLRAARDDLAPVPDGAEIGAVSVGTPHASVAELRRLAGLVRAVPPRVPLYVNTGRSQLAAAGGGGSGVADAGVTVVTDTCTYVTPVIGAVPGPVMTDSGKWAWYAPSNVGVGVALGSLEECVRSAAAGRVERDTA